MQLFIDNQQAVLMPDTSISIEVHSPIFDADANGAFSYEFKIDAERNRHIVGNADLTDGESVYKQLHLKPFRLVAEGVPILSGVVRLNKTVTIDDGMIPISLASDNKAFDELIEGMNCQDVPVGDVLLGTAVNGIKVIGRVWSRVYYQSPADSWPWLDEYGSKEYDLNIPRKETLKPTTYNVSMPYSPSNPFCNMRRCWQKMVKTGSDENASWNKTREYEVSEASEQGSAPSFYVLYWLRQLFGSLGNGGIPIMENQLNDIEDFKRLAFVNTNPCFEVRNIGEPILFANAHPQLVTHYDFGVAPYDEPDNINYTKQVKSYESLLNHSYIRAVYKTPYNYQTYYAPHTVAGGVNWARSISTTEPTGIHRLQDYLPNFDVKVSEAINSFGSLVNSFAGFKALLNVYFALTYGDAYATSENFPDKDVKSTLQALQNAFGIRFLFDSGNQTVRIVLLRTIFRNTTVNDLPGITHSVKKTEEHIKGIRLTYGTSSDDIKEESRSKDKTQYYNDNDNSTTFNYHDFSNITVSDYKEIVHQISAYDKRCFYDEKTGNTYRIKVDSDAKDESTLYPSLFEVAQCNPAEFGDCSDPDLTEEISIGLTPLFANNVAKLNEEQTVKDGQTVFEQKFATFIDADMHGEEQAVLKNNTYSIASTMSPTGTPRHERFTMKIEYSFLSPHNYDRGANEEAPIFKPSSGLVLGLMRGPGSDGSTTIVQKDYDGEGNDEWAVTAGNYAFHSDIMDDYGQMFDYNGDESGIGPDGDDRFSLRLRAEKPNPAYDADSGSSTVVLPDGTEVPNQPYLPIDAAAARRGLADKFYTEYAYYRLHAHTTVFTRKMEIATLRNIDILQRQHIDDKVGFITKLNYDIKDSGLSLVTIELLHL